MFSNVISVIIAKETVFLLVHGNAGRITLTNAAWMRRIYSADTHRLN